MKSIYTLWRIWFASFDTRYRVSEQGAQGFMAPGVFHLLLLESMVHGKSIWYICVWQEHIIYSRMGCRSATVGELVLL